jgi:DNA-binding SARP family transcriptional activator
LIAAYDLRSLVDFRLLGPLEVDREGEALRLGSPKQRALLAILLLRANEVVSREAAIDAVWGDDPPERARDALQVYVHGLRKVLGRERIATRATTRKRARTSTGALRSPGSSTTSPRPCWRS